MSGALPGPPTAVVFDLDGTIVQTRIASWDIFREVSEQFDLGIDEPEGFYDLLQDNLFAALRQVCRDEAQAEQVKSEFFRRLGEDYRPELIPGMAPVIRTLAGHCPLAVVSSNSMTVIRRVLRDHGLGYCVSHVFGGDIVESKAKAIERILADAVSGYGRECTGAYAEDRRPLPVRAASTVLVSDTAGDMREARKAGVRAVGVSWGMHSEQELTAAGAEFVAVWPQELLSHLLGDAADNALPATCQVAAAAPEADLHPCLTCQCGGTCRLGRDEGSGTTAARTSSAAQPSSAASAAHTRTQRRVASATSRVAGARLAAAGQLSRDRTAASIAAAVRVTCR